MDTFRARAALVKDWRRWATAVADAAKEVLPAPEVYVFGSVVTGRAVDGSDVDILVVETTLPKSSRERASLKVRIEEKARLPAYHPFEIHLVTKDEAEGYFARAGVHLLKLT